MLTDEKKAAEIEGATANDNASKKPKAKGELTWAEVAERSRKAAEKHEAKKAAKKAGRGKKAAKVEKAVAEAKKKTSGAGSDLTPEQAAKNLIKRYDQWQSASAKAADVAKAAADSVKSAEERFRESVEAGRNIAGSSAEKQRDAIEKLMDIEKGWANWQDAIAESSKSRDEAKKAKKTAWKAVERAVDETRQLSLFK